MAEYKTGDIIGFENETGVDGVGIILSTSHTSVLVQIIHVSKGKRPRDVQGDCRIINKEGQRYIRKDKIICKYGRVRNIRRYINKHEHDDWDWELDDDDDGDDR